MNEIRPEKRYHHGDLRRALLEEAQRTIREDGVDQLTLRTVATRLGVSQTAIYRHFADKKALLAAVGREGFDVLRESLAGAWDGHGRGRAGFKAMGVAYVRFAVAHPSQYRVMFGGFIESNAFDVLVGAVAEMRRSRLVRDDDPEVLARMIWAQLHGIAMLAIDGQLRGGDEAGEALNRYSIDRMREAFFSD